MAQAFQKKAIWTPIFFVCVFFLARTEIFAQSSPAAMSMRARIERDGVTGQAPAPDAAAPAARQPRPGGMEDIQVNMPKIPKMPNLAGPNNLAGPESNISKKESEEAPVLQTVSVPDFTYTLHHAAVTSLALWTRSYLCLSGSADMTAQGWFYSSADQSSNQQGAQNNGWNQKNNQSQNVTIGQRQFYFGEGHRQGITDVAISPYGDFAYSASYDGSIRRWAPETEKSVRRYVGAKDRLWALAVTPDDSYLIGACNDGNLYFWDAETAKKFDPVRAHNGPVFDVDIAHSGNAVVSGGADALAKIMMIPSFATAVTLTGHQDKVYSVAFSDDDRFVLTASRDKTARLWDCATGKEICRFVGHEGAVRKAIFLSASLIATAGDDATVRVWQIPSQVKVSAPQISPSAANTAIRNSERGFGLSSGLVGASNDSEAADDVFNDETVSNKNKDENTVEKSSASPVVVPKAFERIRFIAPSPLFSLAADQNCLLAGGQNGQVLLWDYARLFNVADNNQKNK